MTRWTQDPWPPPSSKMPKAPDHDVSYWRGAALFLAALGLACWIFIPTGGFWMMAVFLSLAGGAWSLTRGRE